ncbi:MAG: NAD(P)/FAD-dependent oxidoreductase [Paracoccaceae bacterium]
MQLQKVIVVGGGYAGVMCALRLAGRGRGRGKLKITLVNPREEFVERLRLHEALTVPPKYDMRSFRYDQFLAKRNVAFVCGQVVAVSPNEKEVRVSAPDGTIETLAYDRLVVASGSTSALGHIPGQNEHAFAMNLGESRCAPALKQKLSQIEAPRVSIVGGGATGIELAAEIAQKPGASVTLMCRSTLGEGLTEPVRRRVRAELIRQGVSIQESTLVKAIASDYVTTDDQKIAHDLCVTATGFEVDQIWGGAGLEVLSNGRIVTDTFLRAKGYAEIYAAGDAAYCQARRSAPPRMSVMYAMASGAHIADAIVDEAKGKIPRRFGFWTYGQAIGLGAQAVGFGNMRFDRAYAPYFTGRTGYHLRHFFVAILFRLLLLEARMPGFPFYLGRPSGRNPSEWCNQR